ncbi:MAG: hypothetical protein WBD12_05220, partial [Candidatus Omnitrophota bacterium]
DIDGRTYEVDVTEDDIGYETVTLNEREEYISAVVVGGLSSVRIDADTYSIGEYTTVGGEGSVTMYEFAYYNGLYTSTYYSDSWGLLRIGRDSYTVSEIEEFGLPKIKLNKSFSSMPAEAPVRLNGTLYRVTYNYVTGKYEFDDGYDISQSAADRLTVAIAGTDYEITRDPELNTLKLSEIDPINTDFISTYGKRRITLGDGITYSIFNLVDGRMKLSTVDTSYLSDEEGRVQVGSDLYSITEDAYGELLFSRVTASETVVGSLLKLGKAYMAVVDNKNANVDQADVDAISEIYQQFEELDINGDNLLDENDISARKRELEERLAEILSLQDQIEDVEGVTRRIFATPVYYKSILGSVDFNGNGYPDIGDGDIYADLIELYNLMDLNLLERFEIETTDSDETVVI